MIIDGTAPVRARLEYWRDKLLEEAQQYRTSVVYLIQEADGHTVRADELEAKATELTVILETGILPSVN